MYVGRRMHAPRQMRSERRGERSVARACTHTGVCNRPRLSRDINIYPLSITKYNKALSNNNLEMECVSSINTQYTREVLHYITAEIAYSR